MKTYRRILVPTDFSPHSRVALDRAIDVAVAFGSSISLLHVVVPPESMLGPFKIVSGMLDEIHAALEGERRYALERGVADVETALAEGSAAREITKLAASRRYDLVVMGTHGRSGLDHLVIGSVAERVLRHADLPVLIVPRPAG